MLARVVYPFLVPTSFAAEDHALHICPALTVRALPKPRHAPASCVGLAYLGDDDCRPIIIEFILFYEESAICC